MSEQQIYKPTCPNCGHGVLMWCDDGVIRCPVCNFQLPKDNIKPLLKVGEYKR